MDSNKERVLALMSESHQLNPDADSGLIIEKCEQALTYIDKEKNPAIWGAVQADFARQLFSAKPKVSMALFENALTVTGPDDESGLYPSICESLGQLYFERFKTDPEYLEPAIKYLETGFEQANYVAPMLAELYGSRVQGDRLFNWTRRMECLQLILNGLDPEKEPGQWAEICNRIGYAWRDQPNGDINEQLQNRLDYHLKALDALGDSQTSEWMNTHISISEVYRFFPPQDGVDTLALSQKHAREALDACNADTSSEDYRLAVQAVVQSTVFENDPGSSEKRKEALELLDKACARLDPVLQPVATADVERTRALVILEEIQNGDLTNLKTLVDSTIRARSLLQDINPGSLLVLCRLEGEALIAAGRFSEATKPLQEGLDIGQQYLTESSSIDGRLETIHNIGDISGLLCHCLLEENRIEAGLIALERGKGLVWGDQEVSNADIVSLVPENGALLFGCFAADPGFVIVVSRQGATAVRLDNFARKDVMELQRGPNPEEELGGWLYRYFMRNSRPDEWANGFDTYGRKLYESLWRPVIEELKNHGLENEAELVWFAHGGSGALPVHTAWCEDEHQREWLLDMYSLRFAPSVKSLLQNSEPLNLSSVLIVSDPEDNLKTEELENVWIQSALTESRIEILRGQDASRPSVMEKWGQVDAVHVAAHAQFDTSDVWNSNIRLTNDERLTTADFFDSRFSGFPALVVLSACESAVAKVTAHADEFLGFPAALLSAGSRSVLATMWPIDDRVSALITGRFYTNLASGDSCARALRNAQNWLRNATAKELRKELIPLFSVPDSPAAAETAKELWFNLKKIDKETTPFSAPHYWAAFITFGH
ncbi:MAG: CHAT domain-containing protein [Pseudomonadota bacterium]